MSVSSVHLKKNENDSDREYNRSHPKLDYNILNEKLLKLEASNHPSHVLRGVNGFKWFASRQFERSVRYKANMPKLIPKPINTNASSSEEFWNLLITDDMIQLIVNSTNQEIKDVCSRMMADNFGTHYYQVLTDFTEMKAYIGLLYYSGMWKQSFVDCEQLWENTSGLTVYRSVMSLERFMFLSECLCFEPLNVQRNTDKFCEIQTLWDAFISNCQKYYQPLEDCTVGEQLLDLDAKCSFCTYTTSRPNGYGLKIISLNDISTFYMYNAIPYLGKPTTPKNETESEYYLEQVTKPIHGTGRRITCNEWFTSIPAVERMLRSPIELKVTGTIRKNEREIPEEMKIPGNTILKAKYCYTEDLTLLSYRPKKDRVDLLVSSYILNSMNAQNGKPDIVNYYNETKNGTYFFEEMCRSSTTSRYTNRCIMRVFFGILDMAAVNAGILQICYRKNNNHIDPYEPALNCLNRLYLQLTRAHLEKRLMISALDPDIKVFISSILGIDTVQTKKRKRNS